MKEAELRQNCKSVIPSCRKNVKSRPKEKERKEVRTRCAERTTPPVQERGRRVVTQNVRVCRREDNAGEAPQWQVAETPRTPTQESSQKFPGVQVAVCSRWQAGGRCGRETEADPDPENAGGRGSAVSIQAQKRERQ